MKVFNRWGNLLFFKKEFEANVAEEGWDGKVDGAFQNNDTYTYQVRLISVFDGKEIVKEGHFSLLR